MDISSKELFPSNFNCLVRDVLSHNHVEYVVEGGRGSCKSSTVSELIIILMTQNADYNAFVGRKVADTLSESVYEQLLWAIDKLGVSSDWIAYKSPLKIVRKKTQQAIIFRGADKAEKSKSIKLHHGYFALTWLEEVTEYTPKDVEDITLSTMRGQGNFWCFYSFNPPASERNWTNKELKRPNPIRFIHHSDYTTVPREWLGDAFFQKAEIARQTNERAYKNIYLGEMTGSGRTVFENVILREITDEEIEQFEWTYYGLDFGFYPDPTRFNAYCYDMKNKTLYVYSELSLLKHGNYEASEKLKEHFKNEHLDFSHRITGDSAEPKSIADYRQFGWDMRGAIKGRGSLEAGFKWLQQLTRIVIDPIRCPKATDEFTLYEYDIDRKTGEVLTGYPQNQPDHTLANCRYALEEVWRIKGN